METGRPLLQNVMYAAERSALHAKDMHGKSRRNNYCRLYMGSVKWAMKNDGLKNRLK